MAEPGRRTAGAALWLTLAGVSGLIAVAAGAFGAHALAGRVPPADLAAFDTGARYQLAHALALIAVAWLADRRKGPPCRAATTAGWGFFTGTILFSGSLYVLGLTGSRALVWMTPLGGLALLTGWAALIVAARGLRRTL